ncbi:hypothetical protein [Nocardia sp. NBC_00511]|uniref:hypothetical protein n=1 Tax=Nocardia sp. NBC_00511 TaxID=2903591 RepID=UPI0030DEB5CE
MNGNVVPPLDRRIDLLFATFHRRSEPEQSNDEVALRLRDRGVVLTGATLDELRRGAQTGDRTILAALAEHFGVATRYLTDDGPDVVELHSQLELLAKLRDFGIGRMALRGHLVCGDGPAPLEMTALLDSR